METKIINPLRAEIKVIPKNLNPTTSGHAPDESGDGVLGDLLPDLDQGITELLGSLWI